MHLPRPGEMFRDRYKLQEVLGRGGFAIVYRATDVGIGRDVAIKVLLPGPDGYAPDVVSRFSREAQVHAGLQDPHTIVMFDFGRCDDGLLYMVFEYVRGRDLGRLLRDLGPLSEPAVAHILWQLASALREAHDSGILHRDLKPANVLVYDYMGDDYRVKLLDFGIARPLAPKTDAVTITRTGTVVGTPRYMSPEQLCGGELTPASDLYSLGLIAIEALTGRPAVRGTTTREMLVQQLNDVPVRLPPEVRVTDGMRRVIERLVEKQPHRRFSTAQDLIDALDVLGEEPASMAPAAVENGPATPPQQPQGGAAASALATVALALGGVAFGAGVIVAVLSFVTTDDEGAPTVVAAPTAQRIRPLPQPIRPPAPQLADAGVDADDGGIQITDGSASADAETSLGCGAPPLFVGERKGSVILDGVRRSWRTYVPSSYDPDRRHPIVIGLDADILAGGTNPMIEEFAQVADREGFIVIAPLAHRSLDPYKERSDAPMIRHALRETGAAFCVDPARVYAAGHASGARYLEELLCEIPLSAAAHTAHRSTSSTHECQPRDPVPFMYINGEDDKFVPRRGGLACNGRNVLSLREQQDFWRSRNGCSERRRVYSRSPEGTCHTWTCDVAFVSCVVDGGHYWPKGGANFFHPIPGCASTGTSYPYAEEIWKFFEKEGIDRTEPLGSAL